MEFDSDLAGAPGIAAGGFAPVSMRRATYLEQKPIPHARDGSTRETSQMSRAAPRPRSTASRGSHTDEEELGRELGRYPGRGPHVTWVDRPERLLLDG
jgi:hypothetical protein